jgi:Fur family ferric uptake transcriptional regulator
MQKSGEEQVEPLADRQLTPNQTLVLQTLRQQPHSLSAQALHAVICKQQSIGLATVYRSLDALKRLGLVQHRVSVEGETLYGTPNHNHPYLTCLQCGVSFPIERLPLIDFERWLQSGRSFTIYYHTLEFFGICEGCDRPCPS